MKFEANMSYQDILILAMKREEQSMRLYTDMGEKVEDAQLKSLFRKLAGEEAKHKNKLETEYDENVLREN
jgi:rubrerythrin